MLPDGKVGLCGGLNAVLRFWVASFRFVGFGVCVYVCWDCGFRVPCMIWWYDMLWDTLVVVVGCLGVGFWLCLASGVVGFVCGCCVLVVGWYFRFCGFVAAWILV